MRVLFLCTGNSARSQMAEGLARHLGKGMIEAHSAGTEPRGVNPLAIAAMDEVGIDIRDQRSKGIDPGMLDGADVVITLCGDADQKCPSLKNHVRKEHWPLDDPACVQGSVSNRLAVFRSVRDELRERIQLFLRDRF